MKRIILIILGVMVSLTSFARNLSYNYKGQTLTYTVIDETKKTVAVGKFNKVSGYLEIPEIVLSGDEYTVTEISTEAFSGCRGLVAVYIPNSITLIGDYAFDDCDRLTYAEFPSLESLCRIDFRDQLSNPLNYAHNLRINGEKITDLIIPNSVTSIGSFTFIGCSSLTSVTIPNSVTSIGESAFSDCSGLTSVTIPNSVTTIGGGAFDCCSGLTSVEIPNSVTTIGGSAFSYCSRLTSIEIPNSVTTIGTCAFQYCTRLTSVTIGNSVTKIGGYAFSHCSGLTSVEIPNSVTTIGDEAFYCCSGLTSVEIPNSVTTIGRDAFSYCSRLTSIEIPNSVTSIDNQAFVGCSGLTSVTIGNSVSSIGYHAFAHCSGLKSVKLQDVNKWTQIKLGNITSNPIYYAGEFTVGNSDEPVKHLDLDLGDNAVSSYAFYNAQNLETVRVKSNSIGYSAFEGCSNVKYLCLDVMTISQNCFVGNSNISDIYCLTETPPSASDNSFSKYEGVKLYVPKGCVSKYENADTCWCRFLEIYESDFSDIDSIFKADYVNSDSRVEDIVVDNDHNEFDYNAPYEIYNMNGVKVATSLENLSPGIYIARQGNRVKKIMVK